MTLYKLPGTEALIPNEGHAKYVCLDPWVNALLTLASLGTIVTYFMIRCRRHTLCKGLEYTTACHVYVFISSNDRYSPIKLCSVTGLLYNFVTNQGLPMESLELHKGCPWDNLNINRGEVTLTNGDTQIRLPYNVQVQEKVRLRSLMKIRTAQPISWSSKDAHGIQLALPPSNIQQHNNLYPQDQ